MAWYDDGDDDLGWLSLDNGGDLSWLSDGAAGGGSSLYDLSNGLNLDNLGASISNPGSGYNFVADESTPGYDQPLGLDSPELPGLSSMNGAQGLSYDVPGGTVTAAGFVPDGSEATFGDPNSWIFRPSITGKPGAISQDNVVTPRPGGGDKVSTATGGTPAKPGNTPSGTNSEGKKEAGFDWSKLLPLLLMVMASRQGGGSSNQAVIPNLTANRQQTPYGTTQFPPGRRPGSNAQTYFQPVQYKAAGGIAALAAGGQAFGGVQSGAQPAARTPLTTNQKIQQDFARLSQQNDQDALMRYLAATGYTPQQISAAMPQYGAADLAREMTRARNMFAGFSPGEGTILDRNDQGQLVTNALRVGKAAYDYVPSVNPGAAVTVPPPAPGASPAPAPAPAAPAPAPAAPAGLQALVQQTDYANQPGRRAGSGGLFFKPVEYTAMAAGGGIGGLTSRRVRGEGDGTSDHVPAQIHGQGGTSPAAIADGEFILDARTVAEIGNGSTDAGARKLEAMVERIHAERKRAVRGKPSKADAVLQKTMKG